MIYRGRIGTVAVLILVMACGGGTVGTPSTSIEPPGSPSTTSPDASPSGSSPTTSASDSPFTEVTGAIVGMISAADIDDDGQPVEPGFTFSVEAPQITIVARAGEVTGSGSGMNLAWFQITDEGETRLFTHTVEVGSFGVAYSVGTNPGTLAPGAYRVEAALEGESMTTQFEVEAPEAVSATGSIMGARGAAGGIVGQGGATDGPPVSGDSGAVDSDVDDSLATVMFSALEWAPVDPDMPEIRLFVTARVEGGGSLEGTVRMGSVSRALSYPVAPNGAIAKVLSFDPCRYPGSSDLPGATAEFEAALYEGITPWGSDTHLTTLGPDTTPPVVDVTSNPPPGSEVSPGDQIVVSIVAVESRSGTWQTGVQRIVLRDFDTGQVVQEQAFGDSAQPCSEKAWSKGLDIPYTVPDDDRAEIHLVAEAFDFEEGKGTFGVSYIIGEGWEGPVTGHTDQPGCEPETTPVGGSMQLVVADDGTVTGSVTETRATFSCGGTVAPGYEQTYEITGQKTEEAFELLIDGTLSVTLPISGTHATVTVSRPGAGGFGAETIYTVDCVTCP